MKKIFYVYEVWDVGENLPFYVGKAQSCIENRHQQHLKQMRTKKNGPAFHKKLRKMIDQECLYEFRNVFESFDEKEALQEEIRLIDHYGRRDLDKGPLLNLTNGGEGASGRIPSTETRKKWSEIRKGRPATNLGKRYKHKTASPKKGKPWSEAQRFCYENRTPEQIEQRRQRSSLAHKGQIQTKAMRAAQSSRMSGDKNPNFGKGRTERKFNDE